MKKFFERVSTKGEAPQIASFSNMMTFYSLLFVLVAIPFLLIVSLVWLTGVIGFSTYIFLFLGAVAGLIGWRVYRRWQQFKARLAAQGAEMGDIVKEAARSGKDVEVSVMNGLLTFRYHGRRQPPPLSLAAPTLALAAPAELEGAAYEPTWQEPSRLRQELEGFSRLRDAGVISPEEFEAIKTRLMAKFTEQEPLAEFGQAAN
jgi:hypothetical protein